MGLHHQPDSQERQELPDPTKETEEVQNLIYHAGSVLLELREELFDQVEPIFKIFSEKDKVFETRGKTKQIKEGTSSKQNWTKSSRVTPTTVLSRSCLPDA
jgi:hypothetical protein